MPLRLLRGDSPLCAYFVCILADFRNQTASWEEVVKVTQAGDKDPLERQVYAWPMVLVERRAENTLFARLSFSDRLLQG
jgi:hypothetical protein